MNDENLKSLCNQNQVHDSDTEFYDAYETMEHKMGQANLNENSQKNLTQNSEYEKSTLEAYSDSEDDNDNFMTMKTDFKDFESKPFLDRHERLNKDPNEQEDKNKNDDEDKFVPLHERLNNEAEEEAGKSVFNEEDAEEEDSNANDPYYIDVELLEKEFAELSEAELEEKLKVAQEFKACGNVLFKDDKFPEALEEYTKALRSCPLKFEKERSVFHSNRSICYSRMSDDLKCIKECTQSIELNPKFVKPLLRRAECNQTLDKLDEVLNDYKKLCELDPINISYQRKCMELEETIKARNEKLKEEMMGKLKDLGNMCLKPFGLSTNNFQFVQDPATGSYSVNFSQ